MSYVKTKVEQKIKEQQQILGICRSFLGNSNLILWCS